MYLSLSFIIKIGFVVSMMILSGYIYNKCKHEILNALIQGFLFTVVIRIDMLVPFVAMSETHFDVREILLNISGLYYGPLASGIAAVFTVLFRLNSNPVGAVSASVGIVVIYIFTASVYMRTKPKDKNTSLKVIFFTSILSNLLSLISILVTPGNQSLKTLTIAIIIMVGFPVATVASSKILNAINLQFNLMRELKTKEMSLSRKNESLRSTITELRRQEMLLNKNEAMFKTIFLNSSEASLVLENLKISKANKESMFLLSYDDFSELDGKSILDFLKNDKNAEETFLKLVDAVGRGENVEDHEFIILNKYGKEIDVEISFSEINFYKKDYIYISLHDIRIRKLREREVIKNSQLDVLTGVYNRAYLDEYIKNIRANDYPVGIIMADLNGLKLVNDFLGHNRGDTLLMKAVFLLKRMIGNEASLIRMGGDEFLILLPNSDEAGLEKIMGEITDILMKNNMDKSDLLSLSTGAALCYSAEDSIAHGIEKADHEMYERKVVESMLFKERFLDIIYYKNLQENPFKQNYSAMIAKLCESFAEKSDMDEHHRDLLRLAYKYYDLGGIHGADYLRENGNIDLTYNLLRQIPKVSEASIYIFYLSENWDGSGRNKLAGEAIPVISRIIRLVHDYCFAFYDNLFKSVNEREAHNLSIKKLKEKAGLFYDETLLNDLEKMEEWNC